MDGRPEGAQKTGRETPMRNTRLSGPLSFSAILPLILLAAIAALIGGALPANAQGPVPDTPDRPVGNAVFVGGVDLEWNDVPGAHSYDVQLFRNGQ